MRNMNSFGNSAPAPYAIGAEDPFGPPPAAEQPGGGASPFGEFQAPATFQSDPFGTGSSYNADPFGAPANTGFNTAPADNFNTQAVPGQSRLERFRDAMRPAAEMGRRAVEMFVQLAPGSKTANRMQTGMNALGTAQAMSEQFKGSFGGSTIREAASNAYANRDQFMQSGKEALKTNGKEVAKGALGAAAEAVGSRYGLSIDVENRKVAVESKRALAKGAFRLMAGGGAELSAAAAVAGRAGFSHARSESISRAQSGVASAFNNPNNPFAQYN